MNYCSENAKGFECHFAKQCRYCAYYQSGFIEPTSPVPALFVDSMDDLAKRWSSWVDTDALLGWRW